MNNDDPRFIDQDRQLFAEAQTVSRDYGKMIDTVVFNLADEPSR